MRGREFEWERVPGRPFAAMVRGMRGGRLRDYRFRNAEVLHARAGVMEAIGSAPRTPRHGLKNPITAIL